MKKSYVIIGGSHGISASLVDMLKAEAELYCYARTEVSGVAQFKSYDVLKDEFSLEGLPEAIDGVVYAPGSINLKPFHLLKDEDWEAEWRINVMGAVKILRTLYPRLKKSSNPSVVLFSSVAATKAMPYHASIAASKAAVEALVRTLAIEWAPTIRINAIAPSLTETPLAQKLTSNAKVLEQSIEKHPLKRIGQANDIAQMAKFLLSQEASWITGQTLAVDGGMSL